MKRKASGSYGSLKRKVFGQLLAIMAIAIISVLLLRSLLRGQFGNSIVSFLIDFLGMDQYGAHTLYQQLFRNNLSLILFVAILLFFCLLLWLFVSRFTAYFEEINHGMDQLLEEAREEITLSPEMEVMEKRLNSLKQRLEKRARDAREAEQRKNDLVIYLAHDIKTPLTSVIGYLNLLDEAQDMPSEQKAKYVGITLEKAYRLEQLIDEFFDIARFNLQNIVLNKETINLPFMLHQMADEFYPLLSPKGKTAAVFAPDDLTLTADPDKLSRVFNNILKNAAAYSNPDTVIRIEARRGIGQVIISFSNQGPTIPPNKLATIFEKFFRLDQSRSSQTGGAGLGLAIAKEIVEAHGGKISAQSNEQATIFTVILPDNAPALHAPLPKE